GHYLLTANRKATVAGCAPGADTLTTPRASAPPLPEGSVKVHRTTPSPSAVIARDGDPRTEMRQTGIAPTTIAVPSFHRALTRTRTREPARRGSVTESFESTTASETVRPAALSTAALAFSTPQPTDVFHPAPSGRVAVCSRIDATWVLV